MLVCNENVLGIVITNKTNKQASKTKAVAKCVWLNVKQVEIFKLNYCVRENGITRAKVEKKREQ